MKKRILSLLIVMTLIIGSIPAAFAADKDPFSQLRSIDYDEMNGFTVSDWSGADATAYRLESGKKGSWVKFSDVNFGTKKGVTFTINCGGNIPKGCDLVIMKGAKSKSEGGVELGRVESVDTGSWAWTAYGDLTVKLPNPSLCTGKFDLYFVLEQAADGGTDNFGNLRWFYFTDSYNEVTAPTYTDGTTVSAAADITRYIDNSTKKARLLLAEYNADGTMIKLTKSDEQTIVDGTKASFSVTGVTKNANTSYLGAFLWQNDNTAIGNASIGSSGQSSGSPAAEKIGVDVSNTLVSISGSQITDDRVLIAVVAKNDYDSSKPLYDNKLVQLWETAVTNGKYDYRFKMDLNLPSGDFYAVVKGAATSEIKEFSYKSPYDTYLILNSIDNNAADSDVVSVLAQNPEVFGIEAELYGDMSVFDMAEINSSIQNILDNKPLTSGMESYEKWTASIKQAVLPQAVVSYIKNVKNASKSIDYILKYAAELGVDGLQKFSTYYKTPTDATQAEKEEYENNRKVITAALINVLQPTDTAANFADAFEEAVIVGRFNKAISWGYADEALRKFASEIPIDISGYVYLKNEIKNEMMDKFINRGFRRKSEIKTLYESLIGVYAIPENYEELNYERIPSEVGEEELFAHIVHLPKDETETGSNAFRDIDGVSWAVESINYMSASGYVNGKGDGCFDPNGYITREEFAAIVVRVFELGEGDPQELNFTDVDKNAWYAPYIASLVKRGIVNGTDKNRFGVGEFITREQIASILKRAAQATYKNILPTAKNVAFSDSESISDYAYAAVYELARAGVINGKGEDLFMPKANATRAEATVMLHRLLQSMI